MNIAALDAQLEKFSFDTALFMSSSLGDPITFTRRVTGQVPHSDRFTANEELNTLLNKNTMISDPVQRKVMVDKAQQIYAEELPAYYLYVDLWSCASSSKIRPFYTTGGILQGVPMPLNKLIFLQDKQ